MSLTLYLSAVQKVEVMPDKAPLSVCDSTVTEGRENPVAANKPSVMTNSTADDSSKKRKNTSPDEVQPTKRTYAKDSPICSMTELKQMEERLHTSLTTSLTMSLTSNLKEELKGIVSESIKGAVDTLNRAASRFEDYSGALQKHDDEIKGLKEENDKLLQKVTVLETEHGLLKSKLSAIECKTLECCLVFKGIPDTDWEKETVTIQKLYWELSRTADGETEAECMSRAKNMLIKHCKRLGRFQENKSCAISVEFQLKQDADYMIENKKSLGEGIFVDREYSNDVERRRKSLRPVLKAAREHKDLKKKCKLEGDWLVIHGKRFSLENLHNLPKELDVFKITSKSNNNTIGFFGELNPLSNCYP